MVTCDQARRNGSQQFPLTLTHLACPVNCSNVSFVAWNSEVAVGPWLARWLNAARVPLISLVNLLNYTGKIEMEY